MTIFICGDELNSSLVIAISNSPCAQKFEYEDKALGSVVNRLPSNGALRFYLWS